VRELLPVCEKLNNLRTLSQLNVKSYPGLPNNSGLWTLVDLKQSRLCLNHSGLIWMSDNKKSNSDQEDATEPRNNGRNRPENLCFLTLSFFFFFFFLTFSTFQ
jgi:hypothetical protein